MLDTYHVFQLGRGSRASEFHTGSLSMEYYTTDNSKCYEVVERMLDVCNCHLSLTGGTRDKGGGG